CRRTPRWGLRRHGTSPATRVRRPGGPWTAPAPPGRTPTGCRAPAGPSGSRQGSRSSHRARRSRATCPGCASAAARPTSPSRCVPDLRARTPRPHPARSTAGRAGALGEGGDDVLVAGAGEAGEVVDEVGVEADQQARPAAEDALLDHDPGGLL